MPDRAWRATIRQDDLPVGKRGRERRKYRRAYLWTNAYELLIAVSAIISGAIFFVSPAALAESSIGEGGAVAYAWCVLYVLGGLGVTLGMIVPRIRWELAGLSLLATAIIGNGLTVVLVRGPRGYGVGATFVCLAVASVLRAMILYKIARRRLGSAP